MKIGIIGGGAAGFFSAIAAKENYPHAEVTILEKSDRLLSKVKISGGGRCNVTNACGSVEELCEAYPRGGKSLKKMFYTFSNQDAMKWFESRGVPLITQEDNCVFPKSQNSQSIIDCFMKEAERLNIEIELDSGVKKIESTDEKLEMHFISESLPPRIFDKVIVATGGSPKKAGLNWLENLGHKIKYPVPSLFSFNMPSEPVTDLMGIVVKNTLVNIQGTKIKAAGPLLMTHWGMSGPVILKLSSFGARLLNEKYYKFKIQVNWVNETNNETVMQHLRSIMSDHANKILSNYRPYALPERLWHFHLEKYSISAEKRWGELGNKDINKISNFLTNEEYSVNGKSTFKEEFVTCGGVSLKSIDLNTMQSKVCKDLYFAGEVLDIDGITGGFNFQAAWTTGFIAGKLL
ncbi:MAG TPA: NAD(P)/FAD-dependent oxidoreductase [Clostridiales bacterium]|nr:NAD(P)/FAD-dependent oxidoreductase [Clostridiales bacterium]